MDDPSAKQLKAQALDDYIENRKHLATAARRTKHVATAPRRPCRHAPCQSALEEDLERYTAPKRLPAPIKKAQCRAAPESELNQENEESEGVGDWDFQRSRVVGRTAALPPSLPMSNVGCKIHRRPTRAPEFGQCRSCVLDMATDRQGSFSELKSAPPRGRERRGCNGRGGEEKLWRVLGVNQVDVPASNRWRKSARMMSLFPTKLAVGGVAKGIGNVGNVPESEFNQVYMSNVGESGCKMHRRPTRAPEFGHCRSCVLDAATDRQPRKSAPPTARSNRSGGQQIMAGSGCNLCKKRVTIVV